MSKKKKMQEKAATENRTAVQKKREDDYGYGYGYGPDSPFTPIIQLPPIVQPIIMMPIAPQIPDIPMKGTDDFDDFDDFDDDTF